MRNKIILSIIRFLGRYLKPNEPTVKYKSMGFQNNPVREVNYPLSYILTTHENNTKRDFVCSNVFRVEIDAKR